MYILFEYDYFFDQLTGFFIRVSTINEYICFTTLYYFQWQNKKFQGSSATHILFVSLSDHYSSETHVDLDPIATNEYGSYDENDSGTAGADWWRGNDQ